MSKRDPGSILLVARIIQFMFPRKTLWFRCHVTRRPGNAYHDKKRNTTTRNYVRTWLYYINLYYIYIYIYLLHMFKLSHLLAFRDAIAFCRPSRLCVSLARCGSDEFSWFANFPKFIRHPQVNISTAILNDDWSIFMTCLKQAADLQLGCAWTWPRWRNRWPGRAPRFCWS